MMGSCCASGTSHKKQTISFSNISNTSKSSYETMMAPPQLIKDKSSLSNSSEENKMTKKQALEYLTSQKLNNLLQKNERITSILLELVSNNSLEKKLIGELVGEFLELIENEEKNLEYFIKPKIFSKIFEEYHQSFYKQYSSVFVGTTKEAFFNFDYCFSFEILCETIEIYQILLSYKLLFKKKNSQKQVKYWWFQKNNELNKKNYTIIDTFIYLESKFKFLSTNVFQQYKNMLADYAESLRV